MPTLNRVELVGSLSRDPQVRYSTHGKPYTEFCLTVHHNLHSADAECHGPADRFVINVVGKLGEMCLQQLKKGWLVQIEGQLHSQHYQDALSGQLHSCTIVVATRMQMLNRQAQPHRKTNNDAEPVWLAV